MIWTLAIVTAIGIALYVALQVAVGRNGPAVVDAIDRITGGEQGVEPVARASYGSAEAQKLSVYRLSAATGTQPVILFVHGGSWATGDADDYGFVGRNLAARGFTVVVPGYRLFPEARYPAMLEDTAAAIGWTLDNIASFGGDSETIWLIGHSAGAYNIVQTVLDPQWLAKAGVSQNAVGGVVALAGPYDFHPFDKESTRNSFGDAADPATTQPINHARSDAPPLLLIHGQRDETVKVRNTRALARAVERAGGDVETAIYPSMDHNAPLLSLANPWRDRRPVLSRIERFIADRTAAKTVDGAASSLAVQADSR